MPQKRISGKTDAARKPVFSAAWERGMAGKRAESSECPAAIARSLRAPAILGPTQQPTSPANASRANMAVPPAGMRWEAVEYIPGHMTPTAKPDTAQPMRERRGQGEKTVMR